MTISVSSDAVAITQAICSAVVSLAWPTVILIAIIVLRKYLAAILGRATGLEWGSLKLTFERQLEEAEKVASVIEPTEDAQSQDDFSESTQDLPPEYMILDAWRSVERELNALASRADISRERGQSSLYIMRALQSRRILDPTTVALLNDLRALRNVAVHGDENSISREQALRFRDIASVVLSRLRDAGHTTIAVADGQDS